MTNPVIPNTNPELKSVQLVHDGDMTEVNYVPIIAWLTDFSPGDFCIFYPVTIDDLMPPKTGLPGSPVVVDTNTGRVFSVHTDSWAPSIDIHMRDHPTAWRLADAEQA